MQTTEKGLFIKEITVLHDGMGPTTQKNNQEALKQILAGNLICELDTDPNETVQMLRRLLFQAMIEVKMVTHDSTVYTEEYQWRYFLRYLTPKFVTLINFNDEKLIQPAQLGLYCMFTLSSAARSNSAYDQAFGPTSYVVIGVSAIEGNINPPDEVSSSEEKRCD